MRNNNFDHDHAIWIYIEEEIKYENSNKPHVQWCEYPEDYCND